MRHSMHEKCVVIKVQNEVCESENLRVSRFLLGKWEKSAFLTPFGQVCARLKLRKSRS